MKNKILLWLILFAFVPAFGQKRPTPSIVYFKQAKGAELLAAKELQRYLYLRTGELPALKAITTTEPVPSPSILVASYPNIISTAIGKKVALSTLKGENYTLKSFGPNQLLIIGGSEVAALYGAYKFLESMGIGFSLHGDIIPDEQAKIISLSGFNQTYQPAFALRGIQPFHDFAEGPDWWNEDEYKVMITQLPKMGMNFIGYPEKTPFDSWKKADHLTWVAIKDQINANDSAWAYESKKTSDYHFGASQLFETDIFGADYRPNHSPRSYRPQENTSLKIGKSAPPILAQKLGVQTYLGNERPLANTKKVQAPFTLATSGWVLGASSGRTEFDPILPRGSRNLSPAFLALAKAGWEDKRDYPVDALYREWVQKEFGTPASDKLAGLFAQLDGGPLYEKGKGERKANFFRSSEWGMKGPGRIKTNTMPWTEVEKSYAFIADYENCQLMITGAGNLDRYQYWLNTFYYARSQAHVGCLLGEMEGISQQIDKEQNLPGNQLKLASHLLEKRKEAAQEWAKMVTYLLQTVSTMGELGTVANLEQHSLGSLKLLNKYDSLLAAHLGELVPVLRLPQTYEGKSRLVVTTQRTLLLKGEALTQKVRVLTKDVIQSATIFWRPLGKGIYQSKPLSNVGQNVYNVSLSIGEWKSQAMEYYIEVQVEAGKLRYPVNPALNQTVMVW